MSKAPAEPDSKLQEIQAQKRTLDRSTIIIAILGVVGTLGAPAITKYLSSKADADALHQAEAKARALETENQRLQAALVSFEAQNSKEDIEADGAIPIPYGRVSVAYLGGGYDAQNIFKAKFSISDDYRRSPGHEEIFSLSPNQTHRFVGINSARCQLTFLKIDQTGGNNIASVEHKCTETSQ